MPEASAFRPYLPRLVYLLASASPGLDVRSSLTGQGEERGAVPGISRAIPAPEEGA